jgi:proteic killer suppression protein
MRRFKNEETENLWEGLAVRRLDKSVRKQAQRRLQLLMAATIIEDLKIPPSNKLEGLKGNRKGQYSIRVNQQYRLCFKWTDEGPFDIEFTDYH